MSKKMSKEDLEYKISQKYKILSHYKNNQSHHLCLIKDEYGNLDPTEVEALIRSGQYFATIATKLDKISLELKKENESQHNYLQLIVDELLYVQSHYKIKRKA